MTDTVKTTSSIREDRLVASFGSITAVAIYSSAEGSPALATSGDDGTVRRWDAITGAAIGEPLTGHTGSVTAVDAYRTAEGQPALVSGGADRTVRRWDAITGAAIGEPLTGHGDWVRAVAAYRTAEGRPALVSCGDDGTVRRWDAITGAAMGEPLTGHTDYVRAVAAYRTAEGRPALVSCGDDGTVRRWDATTGAAIGEPLTGHANWVWAVAAYRIANGRPALATGSWDGTVRRWDAITGVAIGEPLTGHTSFVVAVAVYDSANGRPALATGSWDGTVRCWDAITGAALGEPLTGHTGSVHAVAVYTTEDRRPALATVGADRTVRRWDAITGVAIGEPLTGHTSPVQAVAVYDSADGRPALVTGGDDGTVRRWDAATGTAIGEPLTGHIGSVLAVAAYTTEDDRPALASGGADQTVRRWDATTGTAIGEPLRGHTSFVQAVAAYRTAEGRPALASASWDGTVRRWDATTGAAIGRPLTLTGNQARWRPRRRPRSISKLRAVAVYPSAAGRPALASGGDDGTVLRWDATTGAVIGEPLTGHGDWMRAVAAYHAAEGRPALATVGDDGMVRRWDAIKGAAIGEPLTGHAGYVRAVAAYRTAEGRAALVSGGDDGTVRRWDAITGAAIGEPLTGHIGSVHGVAAYATASGRRLASVGADGTVLLWDATSGELLRRVYVAPIQLRGLADRRAVRDLLGRQTLTQELAGLLNWHADEADAEPGPSVVTIEGPWGAGKTSIMGLVREQIAYRPPEPTERRRLSVRAARKLLRQGAGAPTPPTERGSHRGAVTAWFNPWAHQSSEQVWAGLARAILDAAEPVLYPDEDSAQRYWFTRNIAQIDRHALRRRLTWRTFSPLFGLAAVAALSTVVFKVAALKQPTLRDIGGFRVTPGTLALALGAVLLLAALVHTAVRYLGRAAALLPAELVRGPVLSGALAEATPAVSDALRDPLYEARSGYLYLIQHDIDIVMSDLQAAGYDLVVFIDDLDRCSDRTTAEVFEAVNLFLSGTINLDAKFVIGLDPGVVAAHLDTIYEGLADPSLVLHGDDPSPGWAFLRKVVQLPVGVPHVADDSVDHFVAAVLNVPGATVQSVAPRSTAPAPASAPAPPPDAADQRTAAGAVPATNGQRRVRTGPVERQPEVLSIIRRRLAAQDQRSAREAKRLLNVWQLYYRLLDRTEPLRDDDALVARACQLVILAEIVTRWPALQRRLHRSIDGRSGLQILAAAADDDVRWHTALITVGLSPPKDKQLASTHKRALSNLRTLLREHDGCAVADLAARLL